MDQALQCLGELDGAVCAGLLLRGVLKIAQVRAGSSRRKGHIRTIGPTCTPTYFHTLQPMIEHLRERAAIASVSADLMGMVDSLPDVTVPINSLVPGLPLRESGVDAAHVRLLADAAGSVRLPSILVQRRSARVIDGMHRIAAARLRNEWSINARLVDCTDEEALVLAVRSNTLHGLPLSRADRISGAKRLLAAHPDWSDRTVARVTGVGTKAVASIRNSSTGSRLAVKRLGGDGKRRPAVPGEARLRAVEYFRAHPDASLRQVARETDVSVGTAHDVREKLRRGALHVAPIPPPRATDPPPAERPDVSPGQGTALRPLTWQAIAAKITGDPALRYTEGGRAFLRWMAAHSMQADEWREFADAIPNRWLSDVLRIAAGMSEEWRQFAEQIERKDKVSRRLDL